MKKIKGEFGPKIKEMIASIPLLEMVQVFMKDEVSSMEIFVYIKGIGGIKISLNLPGLSSLLTI